MSDNADYLKTKKLATMTAVIILVLGSIIYFTTEIAVRNNDMMFKEIYGENATLGINNDISINGTSKYDVDANNDIDNAVIVKDVKTELA